MEALSMTDTQGKPTREAIPFVLQLLRMAIRLLAMVSTGLAGRWVNRIWFSTQRFPEPAREREWLAGAQRQTLTHRGRPLAVYAWGEGPTILLVHGWHGRGAQLGAFAAPLTAAGFRVVAFDAPAHGRTPGKRTNLPEVSEALLAVAGAHPPLHGVVAHSFGVACTLYAIALGLEPQRVVAVSAPSSIDYLMDSFAAQLTVPAPVMAVHRRLLEQEFGIDLWQRLSPRHNAAGLSLPALLFHDADDHDVPPSEGEMLAAAWPGAELIRTRGLGHRRILRDPDVIARATAFLRERH